MKTKLYLLFFFVCSYGFSQEIEKNEEVKIAPFFSQFDVSFPLKANLNRNNSNLNDNSDKNWFVPNGLNAKYGFGYQYKKWIGLSLHTGIDWKANAKLVAVPVFANLRLSPGFGNGSRITLQAGIGKGFALGRGNLSGLYQKLSIGIETLDDVIIFAEVTNYKFNVAHFNDVGSFSLGIAIRTF